MSDKNVVKIVLHNLLSNAAKYTPERGMVVFKTKLEKDRLLFIVRDSGWGIPADEQEKIFSQFYRAENIKTKEAGGIGLGLYMSKLLLKAINGKIWFASRENEGTTFYLSLPLVEYSQNK